MVQNRWALLITVAVLFVRSACCLAADEVRLAPGQSEDDRRHHYPHKVLRAALDATVESHGPYVVRYTGPRMTRDRALLELTRGKLINVYRAPTRAEWEQKAIPIRIPIRKGLLGYRLLLINRQDAPNYARIETVEALMRLRAGMGSQWTVTRVMRELGFEVVTSPDYEGLFAMLAAKRFDYFPRGINEVFTEVEHRAERFPEMMIEPTKAIYSVTPTYLFVSPGEPKLADRIRDGLEKVIEDGTLDRLFEEEHGEAIQRAGLAERTIFHAPNPLLDPRTPLDREELWFKP